MFGNGNFGDLDGHYGMGAQNPEDIGNLLKALAVGQAINPPAQATPGDGFPLRVESLEATLRVTAFKMQNIRLFKALPKLAAYNTVEEHNLLLAYGQTGIPAFIGEGDLPEETDATYERKFSVVKYLGTTRKVSHVASLIRPAHGNLLAQETVNGTMYLLEQIERGLFHGDSSLSPVQWDGYKKLIMDNAPSTNIIDLRGATPTEQNLLDGALTVADAPNFGTVTHLFMDPKVHSDIGNQFFGGTSARYDLFGKPDGGFVGLNLGGFVSPAGPVRFEPDVFISDIVDAPTAAVGVAGKIPLTPTAVSAANAAATDGQWGDSGSAGDTFGYQVVACNRFGKSAPVTIPNRAVASVDDNLVLTITANPGGPAPEWYEIFRTPANSTASYRLVTRVSAGSGGITTFADANQFIPGTSIMIGFQMTLEAVSMKQLAPMVKIPLGTQDSSHRWMQLYYGVPILYTAGKIVLYINVGRSAGFVGAP